MDPQRARLSIAIFGMFATMAVFALLPCGAEGQAVAAATTMQDGEQLRPQGLFGTAPPKAADANDCRPLFEPSNALHISPSQEQDNANFGGPDFWSRKGYSLKDLLSEIYDVEAIRVELPAGFDEGKRYDFALVTPEPRDQEAMHQLARQGIDAYFHGSLVRERRLVDVYVVTTVGGAPPLANPRLMEVGMRFDSMDISFDMDGEDDGSTPSKKPGLSAVRSFSMGEGTIEDFRRNLEGNLDRPVVDETGLKGIFDFAMKGDEDANSIEAKNDFLERMRDQLHLAIKPGQRSVETLVFHPR